MANVKPDQIIRIQRVAAEVFARKGYDATGVADLGEAVGLGRGALYHHIGSKENLLYKISIAHVSEMVDFGNELLKEDLLATEKFRALGRRLMSIIAENLPELTVFFADSRALTGQHREDILALRHRFEEIWVDILAQGAREKVFHAADPLLVKGILGMFNYSYVWLRPRGNRKPHEIADVFCDVLLAGLMIDAEPAS